MKILLKPIALIWLIGSGKSSVGKILKGQLECKFIDTDSAIIDELGISLYIDCVATSGMAGAAKPDRALFRYALDLISARPEQAAHVGDDYEGDVLGAVNAGMLPILIDREQKIKNQDENIISITSLNQLKQIFI